MASIITSSKWTLYDSYSLPTRATQTKIITNEHINYRSMCNRSHLFIIDTRYLSLILVYYACTFVTSSRVHLYYIQENNDIFPVNRLRIDCAVIAAFLLSTIVNLPNSIFSKHIVHVEKKKQIFR